MELCKVIELYVFIVVAVCLCFILLASMALHQSGTFIVLTVVVAVLVTDMVVVIWMLWRKSRKKSYE